MRFSDWLQQELNNRGLNSYDLAKLTKASGFKISRSQITHILNETRKAGPDACIAIAYALDLPREEVFRARGWLLREPSEVIPPSASTKAAKLIKELTALPLPMQEMASEGLLPALRSMTSFADLERAETASRDSQRILQSARPRVKGALIEVVDWLAEFNDYPDDVQKTLALILRPRLKNLLDGVHKMWETERILRQPISAEEALRLGALVGEFRREFPDAWREIERRLAVFREGDGQADAGDEQAMALAA